MKLPTQWIIVGIIISTLTSIFTIGVPNSYVMLGQLIGYSTAVFFILYSIFAFCTFPFLFSNMKEKSNAINALIAELKQNKNTLYDTEQEYNELAKKYNTLIDEFNNVLNYARKLEAEQHNNSNAAVIPEDILKATIRLCHPDKHNNSKSSNAATSFFIAYRKEYFQ